MANALEEFVPMFVRASAEWDTPCSLPLRPFLFHVYALDSKLMIHATDFCSYTWECKKSVVQLEDLRADVAVGGSLSELVDYLIASLNSGNVRLVLGGLIESKKLSGATYGKLITHKSKGMPVVTICLDRITNESADNAIGKLSWDLFEAFKREHELVAKEQARSYRLSKMLEAEKAKSEDIQDQLRMFLSSKKKENLKNDKASKMLPASASASLTSLDATPISASPVSVGAEKLPSQSISFKAETRVVPAYRREKACGIFLEDEDGGSN